MLSESHRPTRKLLDWTVADGDQLHGPVAVEVSRREVGLIVQRVVVVVVDIAVDIRPDAVLLSEDGEGSHRDDLLSTVTVQVDEADFLHMAEQVMPVGRIGDDPLYKEVLGKRWRVGVSIDEVPAKRDTSSPAVGTMGVFSQGRLDRKDLGSAIARSVRGRPHPPTPDFAPLNPLTIQTNRVPHRDFAEVRHRYFHSNSAKRAHNVVAAIAIHISHRGDQAVQGHQMGEGVRGPVGSRQDSASTSKFGQATGEEVLEAPVDGGVRRGVGARWGASIPRASVPRSLIEVEGALIGKALVEPEVDCRRPTLRWITAA